MSESTIIDFINTNFWVGCIGALAPEAYRLYKLRTNAVFKWNPGYIVCTIPFVIIGGFIASLSEPTAEWAAFYSGLSAPILINTAAKDSAKVEKELVTTKKEIEGLELKSSETQKQKQILQAEIERLERNVTRLENEKAEKRLEETGIPTVNTVLAATPTTPINIAGDHCINVDAGNYNEKISVDYSPSASPSKRNLNRRQMLLVYSMLSIAIVIGIFTFLGVYPTGLFIQISIIVLTIISLVYLLRNNRLFKEYLKGL